MSKDLMNNKNENSVKKNIQIRRSKRFYQKI